ncbi:MAG: hypothetical protein INR69_04535 [Mucilaginibacter polytrichastri]|nr:hypothetical protein [Mucilaginibacter polytrichastri]
MKRKHALITGLLIALLGMGIMGWAFVHPDMSSAKIIIIVGAVLFIAGIIFFARFFKEKE